MNPNSLPPSNPNSQNQQNLSQQDIILQISQSIKSIKNNLPQPHENNLFIVSYFSAITTKRENPVQIFPSIIKKRKEEQARQKQQQYAQVQGQQQINSFSRPDDDINNRRITDFFCQINQPKKQADAPIKTSTEEHQTNPAIKIVKQKLMKKKKVVQDQKLGIKKLKQKSEQAMRDFENYKDKEKNIIAEYLTQNYRLKIYQFGKKKSSILSNSKNQFRERKQFRIQLVIQKILRLV